MHLQDEVYWRSKDQLLNKNSILNLSVEGIRPLLLLFVIRGLDHGPISLCTCTPNFSIGSCIMVGCLSVSSADVSQAVKLPSSHTPSFTAQDAFILLEKCTSFKQMKEIHCRTFRNRLYANQLVATKVIRLCSSYGKLDYASFVLQQIDGPSTFAWNLLIRACTVNGSSRRAILLYNSMICNGVGVDKFTFPFVMKACLDFSCVEKAKEVYGVAIKVGLHGDVYLDNVLIDLYLKCGMLEDGGKAFHKMRSRNVISWTTIVAGLICNGKIDAAHQLFDQMPARNVVSWTAIINAYAKSEKPEKAFDLFAKMQSERARPNEYTLVSLLVASAKLESLKLGCWVHDFALKNRFEIGVFLGTALIDMYSKCGSFGRAKQVFDSMEKKNVATWNTMITSLGVHGRNLEALSLFGEMERMNVEPDAVTFSAVLCACLNANGFEKGHERFMHMVNRYCITPRSKHYSVLQEIYSHAPRMQDFGFIKSSCLNTAAQKLIRVQRY